MDKNVRIAIQLRHKDDSVNMGIGELAYSDYQWDKRRYLYHSNGNNEYVLFKDENTDDIKDMMDKLLVRGSESTQMDPSLIFLYQFDDNGNAFYSDQVNQKWKDWMKANNGKTKPHQLYCYTDGLEVGCTPILHEKCVLTTVRFTGDTKDYADIGKLTEALIEQFIAIENNLTFRVIKLYDYCMGVAHDLHLLDVNQDHKLNNVWARMSAVMGQADEIANWIPTIDYYKKPGKQYEINLSTSDPGYMYKYKLVNTSSSDKTPVFNTSIACETAGRPVPFAELLHSRDGVLLNAFFTYGAETEYTRRDMIDGSWGDKFNTAFSSSPSVPVSYNGTKIGDNDNQISSVSGSVTVDYRTDIPTDSYIDMPWMEVYIECYNFNGTLAKTVTAKWDSSNSTKLTLSDQSMLSGTYTFTAPLSGYYAVRAKLRVFWGTFGSWTDEVLLCRWSVSRGNNSGGSWKINPYIFNNQSNRILTRCQLHDASKYEKNVIINGKSYGWGGNVTPNIDWDDNGTFTVPGSADYWTGSFYGKIYSKPGCDFICKDFHNVSVSGTRDVSGSLHYPDAANYSLLTTANITVSYKGQKAKYSQDWYNTPSIFSPSGSDHTIMLRGGGRYRVISHCQDLGMNQIGVMQLNVGTIGVTYKNTMFYGDKLVLTEDFILRTGTGRAYRMALLGNPPTVNKIASGVPSDSMSTLVRTMKRSRDIDPLYTKPENETGMGYITKVNLIRENRLDEYNNKWITINFKTNIDPLTFKIQYISDETWTEIYKNDHVRVYGLVQGKILYIMTYYLNDIQNVTISQQVGNTMEFILRDYDTNEITNTYSLLPYKPEKYIEVSVEGQTYYMELSDEIPSDNGTDPVVFSDSRDSIIGYLK